MPRLKLLAVFVGGCVGTTVRAIGAVHWQVDPGAWPWPTFVANLVGCLLLGIVAQRWTREDAEHSVLGAGFCGALTTFSTFQIELLHMLDDGALLLAFVYAAASVLLGFRFVSIGRRLAT